MYELIEALESNQLIVGKEFKFKPEYISEFWDENFMIIS